MTPIRTGDDGAWCVNEDGSVKICDCEFYYLIECCTGLRRNYITTANAFAGYKLIDGFCYSVDDSETLTEAPESPHELVTPSSGDGFETCAECNDCTPDDTDCHCCFSDGDQAILIFSASLGDGPLVPGNDCDCLTRNPGFLGKWLITNWDAVDSRFVLNPPGGDNTLDGAFSGWVEFGCDPNGTPPLGFNITLGCGGGSRIDWTFVHEHSTCKSAGGTYETASCNNTFGTALTVYAFAFLSHCWDGEECVEGVPAPSGTCVVIP